MRLFAIADLHLSGSVDKPMDIFGARWFDHVARLEKNWLKTVKDEDCVLIGGDISWASSLLEAHADLLWIDKLPGQKILLRGNHDYWWSTMQKIEDFCQAHHLSTLSFLRNDACSVAGFYLAGTRGWLLESDDDFSEADAKILRREAIRLELSLQGVKRLRKKEGDKPLIALTHFPPIDERGKGSVISEALEKAKTQLCLFGHIHHHAPYYDTAPVINGVRYIMVAADQLNFTPFFVGEDGQFQYAGHREEQHG